MDTEGNKPLVAVVNASNAAEPQVAGTADMADTLKYAQSWLFDHGFNQVQLDRWDHDNIKVSIELGYSHGEVWYRGWVRKDNESWPITKLKATSVHPNDLSPLVTLIGLLGPEVEAL